MAYSESKIDQAPMPKEVADQIEHVVSGMARAQMKADVKTDAAEARNDALETLWGQPSVRKYFEKKGGKDALDQHLLGVMSMAKWNGAWLKEGTAEAKKEGGDSLFGTLWKHKGKIALGILAFLAWKFWPSVDLSVKGDVYKRRAFSIWESMNKLRASLPTFQFSSGVTGRGSGVTGSAPTTPEIIPESPSPPPTGSSAESTVDRSIITDD